MTANVGQIGMIGKSIIVHAIANNSITIIDEMNC